MRASWILCGAACLVLGGASARGEESVAPMYVRPVPVSVTSRGAADQVRVNVRMLEINRTKLRQLGADAAWMKDGEWESVDVAKLLGSSGYAELRGEVLDRLVDALVEHGIARVLADPTIVATNGQKSSLRIGEEVTVPNEDGKGDVSHPACGTELDVIAETLGSDRVRLQVATRVSENGAGRSLVAGDRKVRAPTVRACSFPVELEFGKSAVVTGPVQERTELQASESGTKSSVVEVALMVVVTPEMVR